MKSILRVLERLSSENYISGEDLSKELGVSRASIWKSISTLRRYGYVIPSRKGIGYKLEKRSNLLLPWEVKHGLNTKFIGKEIIHRLRLESTQDLAMSIAKRAEEGTVVIAEEQSKGRGRIDRRWSSPAGGIWFSLILKPKIELEKITILPLSIGLAIVDSLAELGLDAKLKWPNDVMINEKKIAGILIEFTSEIDSIDAIVIGIGINVNIKKEELGIEDATTLMEEFKHEVDRVDLMKRVLNNIEKRYIQFLNKEERIIEDYKSKCITLKKRVIVRYMEEEFNADALDVDENGALLVMLDNNTTRRIIAGDVSIR
ncbi:MAG: biotin--[acetyl-CoA-carboxylase] ligase [Candidatus Nitrosocaldaceae archaeon]